VAEPISYPGLITALLLPWFAGIVLTRQLLLRTGRWNWCVVIGQGYFLGIFATTLIIRLSDWSGAGLHFWGLAAAVALLGIFGILIPSRLRAPDYQPVAASVPMPYWQKGVMTMLLALLAWRYLTIVQEMLLRPLYAWDAWMNWVPKAIVWFHTKGLTPYVTPEQWLAQGPETLGYTLGNSEASTYPPTVPLIQLWSMLGARTWDDSRLFLPWFLAALNLGLALYGHLRMAGASVIVSTVACYMLLSMPYLNVHTTLAGYADLWLAACFGLAVFALHEWQKDRQWAYAMLCLFLAYMCSQLKNPGIVLGGIILTTFVRSWLNLSQRTELASCLLLAVLLGLVLVFGVSFDIPLLGHISFNSSGVSLPVLGDFKFEYQSVWPAFTQSLFTMLNWNLLFYLGILVTLIKVVRGDLLKPASNELLVLALTAVFLVVVFQFTGHSQEALNFVTINRALLHPIPVLVFYLFLQIDGHFSQRRHPADGGPVDR
jgi:hypothetical protein